MYRIALIIFSSILLCVACDRSFEAEVQEVSASEWPVDSIHPSGLVYAAGFPIVRGNCTTCHSAKLIVQNRATRAGWASMIDWMQETQGLHDLGDSEDVILDYLALHYAPVETGRRPNLDVEAIEWYLLEE